MRQNLPIAQLRKVVVRIADILRRHRAMPFYALQYRLGEVARNRIHPQLLRRTLDEVSNNREPRQGRVSAGPLEPLPNIYVSSEMSRDEADELAASVLRTSQTFASVGWGAISPALLALMRGVSDTGTTREVEWAGEDRLISGTALIPSCGHAVTLGGKQRDVDAWISHDFDWVYPTDHRLWRFLISSRENEHPSLIVARKVALPTRTLLKQLQAKALEYFATIVPDNELDAATEAAKALHWSHTLPATRLPDHRVAAHARSARANLERTSLEPAVTKALEIAKELGLGSDSEHTKRVFPRWAAASGLRLPKDWLDEGKQCVYWSDDFDRRSKSARSPRLPTKKRRTEGARFHPPTAEFGRTTKVTRVGMRIW